MRILHVVTLVDDRASFGGVVTVAVNQCLELRRRGHDARIVGAWQGRGQPPQQLEGVPAHLFRARPLAPGLGLSALFSSALVRWVRDHARSFDVAHLHLTRDLVPLSVAEVLQRAEVPYVVQAHGSLRPTDRLRARLLDRGMTRRALLSARHIFVLTPDERDAVARVAGTAEGISLLHNGIVLPERVPASGNEGPPDVLFLGRLQPNRRVMAFAAAAERLVADGVEATFSVVGPDGGDLGALRRFLAARPHLKDRLRYEGVLPHDRAVERLRRADVYVLPSVEDQGAPMSLLEAMAAGVASICTTECGLAGTLAREQAAVLANPSDDALYGAMRRLVVDRALRARISARAAATAASVFSMAPVAEDLEEEYGAPPGAPGTAPRRRLLWIAEAVTRGHVEVWDALRAGTDLTVALLDDGTPARTDVTHTDLAGRGYAVVRVALTRDRAPQALRDLVRDRPDVVVLDGRPRLHAALTRWAGRSGVAVVVADPEAGPGQAAARASRRPDGSRPVDLDLDLRPAREITLPPGAGSAGWSTGPIVWRPGSSGRPDEPGGKDRSARRDAGSAADRPLAGWDVIDLHRHTRPPTPRRPA